MTSKHTAGTWTVAENGGKGDLVGVKSDRSTWFIAEEMLEEDAKLVAAAPDMLEALEAVLTELDRHDIPMACRYRIEDSINKARGGGDD